MATQRWGENAAYNLRNEIRKYALLWKESAAPESQRYGWIDMRTADVAKRINQCGQDCAGDEASTNVGNGSIRNLIDNGRPAACKN